MRLPLVTAAFLALPALASAYEPVRDVNEFLTIVEGREIRLGLFGISLRVEADGDIEGEASGWPVTGSWSWQEGYFCREMDWGGTEIPYNCQLVEARGNQIRFTTDRGAGENAVFNLR